MTRDEWIEAISDALQVDGNIRKLLRANIIENLPSMSDEQLAKIADTLELTEGDE